MISTVFFDFGGVILSSPFDAFNHYEKTQGLPPDTIRTLNATNPDTNAWARLERNEVDFAGFGPLFSAEAAAAGFDIDGRDILRLIEGEVRPGMVRALERIKQRGLGVACLTNNLARKPRDEPSARDQQIAEVMAMFDQVVESSVVGVRKPEEAFYRIALDRMGVEASEVVFLDDLGINCKPARAMGMTTIKVVNETQALSELEAVLGFPLRD